MKKPAKIIQINKVASLKDYEPLMNVAVLEANWKAIEEGLKKKVRENPLLPVKNFSIWCKRY